MCASCNLCEDIEHQIIIYNSLCIAIATVLAVIDNHAYITTHTYRCVALKGNIQLKVQWRLDALICTRHGTALKDFCQLHVLPAQFASQS